ncbi:hypothetical protein chiPu_0033267, partial [Chiloscyllium punctatum]|nr:hypothetical protein [Chiloscyllium punctatum]
MEGAARQSGAAVSNSNGRGARLRGAAGWEAARLSIRGRRRLPLVERRPVSRGDAVAMATVDSRARRRGGVAERSTAHTGRWQGEGGRWERGRPAA